MVAITSGITTTGISPNPAKKMLFLLTPATANSADTVDVTDRDVTGGETLASVDWVVGWDQDTGDTVTVTDSSGTLTIDAAGGATTSTYALLIVGDA